jgi:polysaccharide biosynthesis/export protein ExoF
VRSRRIVATILLIGLLIGVTGLLSAPAIAADADPYHLGVADKIKVKVYEWRNTVGEIHEWASLNGDFSVGPGGAVSLPLIGSVPAAGHTIEELAILISARLQATVSMPKGPEVSVEILQYRPFYILGLVSRPGEYPYRPGMTVMQALALAGGIYRLEDPSLLQLRQSALTTQGDFTVLLGEYYKLLARRARLQAELDAKASIELPAELLSQKDDPKIAQMVAQEQMTFASHRAAYKSQSDALNKLRGLLNEEVTSLNGKIANEDKELGLLQGELVSVSSLVAKGLAVAPREFSARQNEIEMQGRRLDLDTAVLRASEEIDKTDQGLLDLANQYRKETLADLTQTESRLSEVSTRMKVAKAILQQDAVQGALPDNGSADRETLHYTILRQDAESRLQKIEALETDLVQPDDTIKVNRVEQSSRLNSDASLTPR